MTKAIEVEVIGEDQDLNKELVEELLTLTGRQCVLTGSDKFEICHLEHRGMGGDKSKNVVQNLIPLRKDFHDLMDGRIKKTEWNGDEWTDLSIERWEPEEGELEIMAKTELLDWQWKKLPHDYIYYHQTPSLENAEEAHERRERIRQRSQAFALNAIEQGKDLHEAKGNGDHELMGYDSWKAYCSAELMISRQYAHQFIEIYKKYRLELGRSKDQLAQIPVKTLYKSRDKVDEDNIEEFEHNASELSESDLQKEMGWTEDKPPSCRHCALIRKAKFQPNIKQGERKLHQCRLNKHKYIIETLSKSEAEELACEEFSED